MTKNIHLISDGKYLRWKYGNYLSSPYLTLEERSWSPIFIGDVICFVAGDGKQNCIVWKDKEGCWFDDVYDLSDDQGVPLYIARNNTEYSVIRGTKKSEVFPFQITYKATERGIAILRFDTWKPWKGDKIEDKLLSLLKRPFRIKQ